MSDAIDPSLALNSLPFLSNSEFSNLKRNIQLLRIAQLRYLVQKFSLPANGNKNRLIQIVCQILDNIRTTPLLRQIYNETNRLISETHKPFADPFATMKKITVYSGIIPPTFIANFFIHRTDTCLSSMFQVPAGSSHGTINFSVADRSSKTIILDFGTIDGSDPIFELSADVNGFPISIFGEDIRPSPIEITDLIQDGQNSISISNIRTAVPFILVVRPYEQLKLSDVIHTYFGDLDGSSNCHGCNCKHRETFQLEDLVARTVVTRQWKCPICNIDINPNDIIVNF